MIKPEITKYCTFCGDKFTASKSIATFCSNSCRTKAYVKRKKDEQDNVDQEAQHLIEQEQNQKIADERRLKREQKAELMRQEQEKQAEIVRQAKEAKRIQDKQDAADVAEKSRKDEANRQKLRDKQTADEKKLLEDKELRKKENKDRDNKKNQDDNNLLIGKGILILGAGTLLYHLFFKPKDDPSKTEEPKKTDGSPRLVRPIPPLNTIGAGNKPKFTSFCKQEVLIKESDAIKLQNLSTLQNVKWPPYLPEPGIVEPRIEQGLKTASYNANDIPLSIDSTKSFGDQDSGKTIVLSHGSDCQS